MVLLDLDNDGDEDVVIGHQEEAPSMLENLAIGEKDGESEANWIQIRWIGQSSNRSAIGVQYHHELNDVPYTDQMTAGGSYLSTSELRSTFAVPSGVQEVSMEVTFPGGKPYLIEGLKPNSRYVVIEGETPEAAPTAVLDTR